MGGGNINFYSHYEKQYDYFFRKLKTNKTKTIRWPSNLTTIYISERNESKLKRYLLFYVHGSTTHNSQDNQLRCPLIKE